MPFSLLSGINFYDKITPRICLDSGLEYVMNYAKNKQFH